MNDDLPPRHRGAIEAHEDRSLFDNQPLNIIVRFLESFEAHSSGNAKQKFSVERYVLEALASRLFPVIGGKIPIQKAFGNIGRQLRSRRTDGIAAKSVWEIALASDAGATYLEAVDKASKKLNRKDETVRADYQRLGRSGSKSKSKGGKTQK